MRTGKQQSVADLADPVGPNACGDQVRVSPLGGNASLPEARGRLRGRHLLFREHGRMLVGGVHVPCLPVFAGDAGCGSRAVSPWQLGAHAANSMGLRTRQRVHGGCRGGRRARDQDGARRSAADSAKGALKTHLFRSAPTTGACARRWRAAVDSGRTGESAHSAATQANSPGPNVRLRSLIDRGKQPQVATNTRPHLRHKEPAFVNAGEILPAYRPTGESRPLTQQRQVLDSAAENATGHDAPTRRARVTTARTIENTAPPSGMGENGVAVSLR